MNKKELFKLRLQGWICKGTLDDWAIKLHDFFPLQNPSYTGNIRNTNIGVMIPRNIIDSTKRMQDQIILFLNDNTYYILGTEENASSIQR